MKSAPGAYYLVDEDVNEFLTNPQFEIGLVDNVFNLGSEQREGSQ
jgi:hypothetical protein